MNAYLKVTTSLGDLATAPLAEALLKGLFLNSGFLVTPIMATRQRTAQQLKHVLSMYGTRKATSSGKNLSGLLEPSMTAAIKLFGLTTAVDRKLKKNAPNPKAPTS